MWIIRKAGSPPLHFPTANIRVFPKQGQSRSWTDKDYHRTFHYPSRQDKESCHEDRNQVRFTVLLCGLMFLLSLPLISGAADAPKFKEEYKRPFTLNVANNFYWASAPLVLRNW